MTKKELIDFLEPFTDDCPIYILPQQLVDASGNVSVYPTIDTYYVMDNLLNGGVGLCAGSPYPISGYRVISKPKPNSLKKK